MFALTLIFIAWCLQAIYCGYALTLAQDAGRSPAQRYFPGGAALVIAACTLLFLFDQHFFSTPSLNWGVSLVALLFLFASLLAYWGSTSPEDRRFRVLTLVTLALSFLWFTTNSFFLPLLFFPASSLFLAHFGLATAFLILAFGTGILTRRKSARVPASEIDTRSKKRSFVFPLLFGGGLLVLIYFSPAIQTPLILHQREHTFQVVTNAHNFASTIAFVDSLRAGQNEGSIYPADLKIKTARDYLNFLHTVHDLDPLPSIDPEEFEIGNVSRNDPANTSFIRSRRVQYDIHTMIHNLGGTPPYAHGFVLFRRDGKGDFYRNEKKDRPEVGVDPPRTPAYLPDK